MNQLFGTIGTSGDCKGIVYPMFFGIMVAGCKGIIITGSDCFGVTYPW
jgi:hypothetical protein